MHPPTGGSDKALRLCVTDVSVRNRGAAINEACQVRTYFLTATTVEISRRFLAGLHIYILGSVLNKRGVKIGNEVYKSANISRKFSLRRGDSGAYQKCLHTT